jgi:hypothetical protein
MFSRNCKKHFAGVRHCVRIARYDAQRSGQTTANPFKLAVFRLFRKPASTIVVEHFGTHSVELRKPSRL